jgi:4-hydroxy-tetrahydrodipicolinate reductase
MGRELVRLLAESTEACLKGAVEAPGHPAIGQDAGTIAGCGSLAVPVGSELAPLLDKATIVLDFTNPEASLSHARAVSAQGSGLVLGTTGFSARQREELQGLLRGTRSVVAANMSLGITLLRELVRISASVLGESFDVEIFEIHHRMKKDAPSGTALALAEAAIPQGQTRRLCFGRHGQAPRNREEIGVFGLRGGDVVGDHTVIFAGLGERLELTHRAQSRECLARGAIRAAIWLQDKPPGQYSMADVLGLKVASVS